MRRYSRRIRLAKSGRPTSIRSTRRTIWNDADVLAGRATDCVTKLVPDQNCTRCGAMLVPPEIVLPEQRADLPPRTDYVCSKCGLPFRWVGNPPRLVVSTLKSADDDA